MKYIPVKLRKEGGRKGRREGRKEGGRKEGKKEGMKDNRSEVKCLTWNGNSSQGIFLLTFQSCHNLRRIRNWKQKRREEGEESPQLPPLVISYITMIHYQTQEIDIDTLQLARLQIYSDF